MGIWDILKNNSNRKRYYDPRANNNQPVANNQVVATNNNNNNLGVTTLTMVNNLRNTYMGSIIQTLILTILPQTRLANLVPLIQILPVKYLYGMGKSCCFFVTGLFARVAELKTYESVTDSTVLTRKEILFRAIGETISGTNNFVAEVVQPLQEVIIHDINGAVQQGLAEIALQQAYSISDAAGIAVDVGLSTVAVATAATATINIENLSNGGNPAAADYVAQFFNTDAQMSVLYMLLFLSVALVGTVIYSRYSDHGKNSQILEEKKDKVTLLEELQKEKAKNIKDNGLNESVEIDDDIS